MVKLSLIETYDPLKAHFIRYSRQYASLITIHVFSAGAQYTASSPIPEVSSVSFSARFQSAYHRTGFINKSSTSSWAAVPLCCAVAFSLSLCVVQTSTNQTHYVR